MKLSTTYYTLPEAVTVPVGKVLNPDTLPQAPQVMTVEYCGHMDKTTIGDSTSYSLHLPYGYITLDDGHNVTSLNYFRCDHLGNNVAVWSATADSTTQRTFYYPSGLPMAISTGQSTQPYKYNSKEFVEMHELDEYDNQARWYYPAIMRTTTMDPLAEIYCHTSPYAWCGNNPIVNVDANGKIWVNHRDKNIAQKLYKTAQTKIGKLLKKLNRIQNRSSKAYNSEKKQEKASQDMASCQKQIQRLKTLMANIELLNESSTQYTFNIQSGSGVAKLEKANDGTIIINCFDNQGSEAHELTHAAQYEKGLFDFTEPGTYVVYKMNRLSLEVEAYQTEYSISGHVSAPSEKGDAKSIFDIDEDWVWNITNPIDGSSPYKKILDIGKDGIFPKMPPIFDKPQTYIR